MIINNIHNLIFENSELFYIANSQISGKGTFAKVNIKKDTTIGLAFIIDGNSGNLDSDITRTNLGIYTNHSDSPNVLFIKIINKYYFKSSTNIKKGEELTINYYLFDWEGKRDF